MSRVKIPGIEIDLANIYCIGRNYRDHARELGNTIPEHPIVFLKPSNTLCRDHSLIQLPEQSSDVHHEVEMVVALSNGGKNIPESEALSCIAGIGVGIDLTARDLQAQAKAKGLPWSVAKGFDQFAPVSDFTSIDLIDDIQNLDLILEVNGTIRQKDNTSRMIFDTTQLISYLSTVFTLMPGDLIFTGTPSGVSSIQSGDQLHATLGNHLCELNISIV